MKYTDKLGLPIWNKPETDVFDIEQFNEGMQAIDDIVINILKQINDLVVGDTQIDLNGYVKEEVLKEYAKRTELSNFLTQTDLLNYLDKTYLNELATKDELSSYAKTDDLSSYALTSSLSDYALKNSLLNYATKESLDNYALSSDLDGFVTDDELNNYATTNQLQTINNNIANLTDRITTLESSGGGGGDIDFSGNAEDVTYNNPNYSQLTSVDLALDKILDKLYYVKPSITSFNMSPSTTQYEKGQTVSSLSFTWSYNKNITSQSLSNCNIILSDREATYSTPITSNKSFTLTCSDGENTASASKNITFFDKLYWGSKAEGTINSAFILSLSDNKFTTAKAGTYSMTVATGEYGYIAMPTSFGVLSSVWIGGFEATVDDMGEIDFTNASGYTSKYKVYRTGKSGLGSISMQIK